MSKKQKMDLTEKLENIHGGNLIVQDGTTKLRSIFDFVKYKKFCSGWCKLEAVAPISNVDFPFILVLKPRPKVKLANDT